MGKAFDVTAALMSILAGAITWFVLQVIIGVVAWVSIVAGGGVAVAGVLMAAGPLARTRRASITGVTSRH